VELKKTWLFLTLAFHVIGFIVTFISIDKERIEEEEKLLEDNF